MPRFFFHMATKGMQLNDDIGRELTCLSAAHLHAHLLVHKTAARLPPGETVGWMVNVAYENGDVPLVVLFPNGLYAGRSGNLGMRPADAVARE